MRSRGNETEKKTARKANGNMKKMGLIETRIKETGNVREIKWLEFRHVGLVCVCVCVCNFT
jgi:hypothetical protein